MMKLLIALGMLVACEAATKCMSYTWSSTKYVKGDELECNDAGAIAAALAANAITSASNLKCHIPKGAQHADFAVVKGCGPCPTGRTCETLADGSATHCTKENCNVLNEKKCINFKWDNDKYVAKDKTGTVCPGFAFEFKCNKPTDVSKQADYQADAGCGACPANKKCPATCDKALCNSAATLISVVPVIVAALFALLY